MNVKRPPTCSEQDQAAPKRGPGQKRDDQVEKIAAVLDAHPNSYFRVPVLLDILETYAGYLKPTAPTDKARRATNLSAFLGRRCEQNKRGYEHSWNHERDPMFTHGVKFLFYSKFCSATADGLQEGTVETFKAGQEALAVQAQQLAVHREADNATLGLVNEADIKGGPASPLLAAAVSAGPPQVLPMGGGATRESALKMATEIAVADVSAVSHTLGGGGTLDLSKEEADGIFDLFEDGPTNEAAAPVPEPSQISAGEVAGAPVARSLGKGGVVVGVMQQRHVLELQELQRIQVQQSQELEQRLLASRRPQLQPTEAAGAGGHSS